MSDQHVIETTGGGWGHGFRRFIHLFMMVIPWLYDSYQQCCGLTSGFPGWLLVLIIWIIVVVLEIGRLLTGRVLFAQRTYEKRQLSAFCWTVTALATVLWWSPNVGVMYAIIVSCALIDPLLGEGRRCWGKKVWLIGIGLIATYIIWWVAAAVFGIPFWWAFVMAPLIVWAEWYKFRWVDDNALMQWAPLMMSWVLIL